ncbi:MAG: response regulator [Nitrospirae bacterium]|nr:MAG: response regulator [Nitrospirota bacterium]
MTPLRILLAEDSAAIRAFTQTYFKDTPYQLDMAENGQVAVEMFQAVRYDLVFMDLEMPVMNGVNATLAIREWEQEEDLDPVPIIALTSHDQKEKLLETLEVGCTAHLIKPLTKEAMLKTIEEHAGR